MERSSADVEREEREERAARRTMIAEDSRRAKARKAVEAAVAMGVHDPRALIITALVAFDWWMSSFDLATFTAGRVRLAPTWADLIAEKLVSTRYHRSLYVDPARAPDFTTTGYTEVLQVRIRRHELARHLGLTDEEYRETYRVQT